MSGYSDTSCGQHSWPVTLRWVNSKCVCACRIYVGSFSGLCGCVKNLYLKLLCGDVL